MLDAKAEVDSVLRQAITDFTGQFVARITAPIRSSDGAVIKVAASEAAMRTARIRANVEHEVGFLRGKLGAYVADRRTREMLVQAVMEAVVGTYEEWFDGKFVVDGGAVGAGRSGKGKGPEDGVWDPEVFEEWCGGVFKVGGVGLGLSGGEESESEGEEGSERTGGTGLRIRM